MRRRLRSRNVLQAVAKRSRPSSSAEGAPEPVLTSTSSQKLNGSTDLRLNASRLEILSFNLDPQFTPMNTDEDSYKEFIRQAQVFLIGTTHGDKGCAADVRRAIRRIRPDTVVVEICDQTLGNLYCDKSEFHAAFEECENLPHGRLVLGDRDMDITDKRAWNVVGAGELCRMAKDVMWLVLADGRRLFFALSGRFFHDKAKQRAAEDALKQICAKVLPEWWKAVFTERDLYMTHVLHNELESLTKKKFLAAKAEGSSVCPEPLRLVAVVGEDHIEGIKANWDKRVDAEAIEELLTYGSTALRLNASKLEVLSVTFESHWAPNKAEEEYSYAKFFRQGRVYVIGTLHGEKDCAADVRRAMRRIRPDAVMIELCAYREHNLYDDDDNCKFRAAFLEAQNLRDCRVVLGDRDYRITDKRAWNVVGFLQVCRFAKYGLWLMLADLPRALFALSLPVFRDDEATQRESYVVGNQLLAEMHPEFWMANMTERDLYMTHVLHNELESLTQKKFRAARRKSSSFVKYDPKPVRIVAVVGADHVDGIKANWGKRVDAEVIEELCTIPQKNWIPDVVALLTIVVFAFAMYLALA